MYIFWGYLLGTAVCLIFCNLLLLLINGMRLIGRFKEGRKLALHSHFLSEEIESHRNGD